MILLGYNNEMQDFLIASKKHQYFSDITATYGFARKMR